jgi:hypothetical protein
MELKQNFSGTSVCNIVPVPVFPFPIPAGNGTGKIGKKTFPQDSNLGTSRKLYLVLKLDRLSKNLTLKILMKKKLIGCIVEFFIRESIETGADLQIPAYIVDRG